MKPKKNSAPNDGEKRKRFFPKKKAAAPEIAAENDAANDAEKTAENEVEKAAEIDAANEVGAVAAEACEEAVITPKKGKRGKRAKTLMPTDEKIDLTTAESTEETEEAPVVEEKKGFFEKRRLKRQLAREKKTEARRARYEEGIKSGKVKKRLKAALCLGGGGARGFAHIGAIKAFEEAGIDFDFVVGCSAGSLVGALYAAGVKADDMLARAAVLRTKDLRRGFILSPDDPMKVGAVLTSVIGDAEFSDLKKPFYAVATDLVTAKQVILDSGKVATAVSASSAAPLFYRPLEVGEMHLVDGGLLNNIPADVCRMLGADFVVTVDVNPTRGGGTTETKLLAVLKAAFDIMGSNASIHGLINSDVIVAPDLSAFKATDKEGYEDMVRLGYEAAKERLDEILKGIYGGM